MGIFQHNWSVSATGCNGSLRRISEIKQGVFRDADDTGALLVLSFPFGVVVRDGQSRVVVMDCGE